MAETIFDQPVLWLATSIIADVSGTGSPAYAIDDDGVSRPNVSDRTRDPAAWIAPEWLHRHPRQQRVQGMPGARCTRGLVCKVVQRNAHEHTGSAEALRHSLRDGFTAYAVLSPATNSSCHRHRRINGFARPVGPAETSADLTPATGARTTRFCRTRPVLAQVDSPDSAPPPKFLRSRRAAPFVLRSGDRSRSPKDLALRSRSRPTLPRPPHPIPTFVTMANAPREG